MALTGASPGRRERRGTGATDLIPGSLFYAFGVVLVVLSNILILDRLLEEKSSTYGALGMAATLLLGFFLIRRVIVGAAVLNATLYDRRRRTHDVYQQIENYILQPTIIGKAAQVSGFTVLVSVLAFGALFGLIGAIIGVPIAAGLQIVAEELTASRRARIAAADAAEQQQTA